MTSNPDDDLAAVVAHRHQEENGAEAALSGEQIDTLGTYFREDLRPKIVGTPERFAQQRQFQPDTPLLR